MRGVRNQMIFHQYMARKIGYVFTGNLKKTFVQKICDSLCLILAKNLRKIYDIAPDSLGE